MGFPHLGTADSDADWGITAVTRSMAIYTCVLTKPRTPQDHSRARARVRNAQVGRAPDPALSHGHDEGEFPFAIQHRARLAASEGSTLGKHVLRDVLERACAARFIGKDWGSQVLCILRATYCCSSRPPRRSPLRW